tara:strand:+ start:18166 stop:19287 length:1122 start_codon:yes stop_codon:yes gene_type:complete
MKIAISGYKGFIGKHLVNTLIHINNFEKGDIHFIEKKDFNNSSELKKKLSDCEIIIHLAGVNRHENSTYLHDENIRLTEVLITNISKSTKCVMFSSSIQQDLKNPFGVSKLKCCQLFKNWAKSNKRIFINLKIPNVFGPYGKPNYNSFVSTFCHKIVNCKKIKEINNNDVNLIYINDLVYEIIDCIYNSVDKPSEVSKFHNIISINVTAVHEILKNQWNSYNKKNTIPEFSSEFEKNLFNTLRSFILLDKYYPKKLLKHNDERGFFSEVLRSEGRGQFSISKTNKGITRGNHFHTRKIERFIVIKGKALVKLRKIDSDKVFSFKLNGSNLNYIDIPVWYAHNISNIGDKNLLTLFWINEPYDPKDTDTFTNIV